MPVFIGPVPAQALFFNNNAGTPVRMPRSSFYFYIVLLMLLTMKGKYVIDKLLNFAYNIDAGRNTLHTRVSELAFKRHVMPSLTGHILKARDSNIK